MDADHDLPRMAADYADHGLPRIWRIPRIAVTLSGRAQARGATAN